MSQDLHESDDGEVVAVVDELAAGVPHPIATDTEEARRSGSSSRSRATTLDA